MVRRALAVASSIFLLMAKIKATHVSKRLGIVQTTFDVEQPDLLKQMDSKQSEDFVPGPSGVLTVDRKTRFQEILGFGGAFTETSADNWMSMSADDRAKIIKLYFADPSQGGHGYTIGRVPMGSSDFALGSYSFDNVSDDVDLAHFDHDVTHDETSGMLPLMRAARQATEARGEKLKIFASPWSPPTWMKLPDKNGKRSFDGSAQPVGLNRTYMRAWAKYFSAFISAYKKKGIDLWGVTPQNEPEFAAPWDACRYTPEYEAEFVREHLGPILHAEQPGVKIIGFDHNKDRVVEWAKVLYRDEETKKYFDGIGVHWYGGLNTQHLDQTHSIAPDKFILATEACNCPWVVYPDDAETKRKRWSRAEKLSIDILEDIKWWSVGWTDWNLMVNTIGGPNHAGNNCDANIICDPNNTKGFGTVVLQPSYYYMGHFSRFIPPGSRRLKTTSTVKAQTTLRPDNIDSKMLEFVPCDSNVLSQIWHYDEHMRTLTLAHLRNMCAEFNSNDGETIAMKPCVDGVQTQKWSIQTDGAVAQIVNDASQRCLTKLQVPGDWIGLDPGVDGYAGFAKNCTQGPSGDDPRTRKVQKFSLTGSVPSGFQIQTPGKNCMLPVGTGNVVLDAVAFETPSKAITLVAMNLKDDPLKFDIFDEVMNAGWQSVELPAHSIASYTWQTSESEVLLL